MGQSGSIFGLKRTARDLVAVRSAALYGFFFHTVREVSVYGHAWYPDTYYEARVHSGCVHTPCAVWAFYGYTPRACLFFQRMLPRTASLGLYLCVGYSFPRACEAPHTRSLGRSWGLYLYIGVFIVCPRTLGSYPWAVGILYLHTRRAYFFFSAHACIPDCTLLGLHRCVG